MCDGGKRGEGVSKGVASESEVESTRRGGGAAAAAPLRERLEAAAAQQRRAAAGQARIRLGALLLHVDLLRGRLLVVACSSTAQRSRGVCVCGGEADGCQCWGLCKR